MVTSDGARFQPPGDGFLDSVVQRYGGRRDGPDSSLVPCPAHRSSSADGDLHLTVTGDGALLAHCFSQECSFDDILSALRADGLLVSHNPPRRGTLVVPLRVPVPDVTPGVIRSSTSRRSTAAVTRGRSSVPTAGTGGPVSLRAPSGNARPPLSTSTVGSLAVPPRAGCCSCGPRAVF